MTEAQGGSTITWAVPAGPLGALTLFAGQRAADLAGHRRELERAAAEAPDAPGFVAALRRSDVAVIAELKRRSPSKGVINDALDAPTRAGEYEASGAAAISVVTEPTLFGGSIEDLRAVRASTTIPVLRKDFIVDRLQLLEARAAGASAVLLIARALPPARFESLANDAFALGLEVLLEVRNERELEQALRIEGGAIGVNSRDLETLAIEEAVSEQLLPRVPAGRVAVSESGIRDRAGVERASALGADAVLVGSFLSAAPDGGQAVAGLTGVPARKRDC